MNNLILYYNFAFIVVCAFQFDEDGLLDRTDDTEVSNQLWHYTNRCTRRFTPGQCHESVVPVWTFVFQLQNCTERLGCKRSYRTNRFNSYELCMSKCRPLIDLYLQILNYDGRNDTGSGHQQDRQMGNSSRRDAIGAKDIHKEAENIKEPQGMEVEELEDEPIPSMMMYRDSWRMNSDDVFPPDIDYEFDGVVSG